MTKLTYTFSSQSSGRPYRRPNIVNTLCPADNTCAVMSGTRVIFASEAERFSHVKHDRNCPRFALQAFKTHFPIEEFDDEEDAGEELPLRAFTMKTNGGKRVVVEDASIATVKHDHHENHIYEAFYQSGFKEAAVLVNDRYAEDSDVCITLAHMVEGEEPRILKQFSKDVSPCHVYYEAATQVFGREFSEGKLMGLAGYGKNLQEPFISWDGENKTIVTDADHGKWSIQQHLKEAGFTPDDVMRAKDVAFTIQKNFEDVMIEVVKHFKELLQKEGIETDNLCMSGGGILNCPTNSKIVELGLFKNYYASPHPSDGCAESIGRVFRQEQLKGERLTSHRLTSAYLGVSYPRDELQIRKELLSKPLQELAQFLSDGGVVAWYQGGAEYGPRALGHRSFLADPTHKEMLDALNKIKGREMWRPLAPIVPEELFARIFEVENTCMCEFMLRTLKIREKWQPRLQAVCHVDGTTRPQMLKREVNPQLYDLLMFYFEQTKTPCLVNTSLNINGFPIVETPRDFGNLLEEVQFMEDVPEVRGIFVDGNEVYRVYPDEIKFLDVPFELFEDIPEYQQKFDGNDD